jgi:hypothetical protein
VAVCASNKAYAAESYFDTTFFNKYILMAVERMKNYSDVKYDLSASFSKRLNYGDALIPQNKDKQGNTIEGTMCNGAVTQAIIEAIDIYRSERGNRNWNPEKLIPAEAWYKTDFTMLRPHLFSHSYFQYPPLEHVPENSLWPGLRKTVNSFHSEKGMGLALEKFGLGETVKFEDARPGDLVSFDRTVNRYNTSSNKYESVGGHGHSVIFLKFLTKDQKETEKYSSDVKGFKYFSVQDTVPKGLGFRWAYFKGFCPRTPDRKEPARGNRFCRESLDIDNNRAAPELERDHVSDCCVIRTGQNGPRLGRVLTPQPHWNRYKKRHEQIQSQLTKIKVEEQKNIEELLKKNEMLKLYAKGAIALLEAGEKAGSGKGAKARRTAQLYLNKVEKDTGVDLRQLAQGAKVREVNYNEWLRIAKMTPAEVVQKANQQVKTADKAQIDQTVKTEARNAMERSASQQEVPNAKFDGRTY